jgi:hypothetical protein
LFWTRQKRFDEFPQFVWQQDASHTLTLRPADRTSLCRNVAGFVTCS